MEFVDGLCWLDGSLGTGWHLRWLPLLVLLREAYVLVGLSSNHAVNVPGSHTLRIHSDSLVSCAFRCRTCCRVVANDVVIGPLAFQW